MSTAEDIASDDGLAFGGALSKLILEGPKQQDEQTQKVPSLASCSSREAMGRNGSQGEEQQALLLPPPSYSDVIGQQARERLWLELGAPYQSVLDGMTLMEFQNLSERDVDDFISEANVPVSRRGKFRMLHKGLSQC